MIVKVYAIGGAVFVESYDHWENVPLPVKGVNFGVRFYAFAVIWIIC
jgi:hypothetical protein